VGKWWAVVADYLAAVALLEDAAKVGMDLHAAVNALEGLSYELDQMGAPERHELAELLDRVAASADPAQREWIRDLPRNLGLDA
jgi:hypothetical protein